MSDNSIDYMLTTFDNPFNPFTEFEAWFKEDHRLMHYTCELLSETAATSEVFGDDRNTEEIYDAQQLIVSTWPTIYKRVTQSDYKELKEE